MLDELDTKILNIIREDAKLSYRKIATKLGVSTATIMNRINKLEKDGVIRGYHTSVNYEKLGYDFVAMIYIRFSKGKIIEMCEEIAKHPNVSAIYDVTGSFDTIVFTKFKNRKELDKFLKHMNGMEGIERNETRIVLNTFKEEHIKVS